MTAVKTAAARATSESSISPIAYEPSTPYTQPMTSGGTNPPSPPAAPTTPVTAPTLSAGATLPTRAKTAPLAAPRNAAMPRNATVPSGMSGGWKACTTARTATVVKQPTSTGTGWSRSASQPPAGRAATASTTNPAVRNAASFVDRSYAVRR